VGGVRGRAAAQAPGRGIHSFPFQLNLAVLSATRPTSTHEGVPKVLKLSRRVNECKPLASGSRGPGVLPLSVRRQRAQGRAVQVDPIKPALKAPGTERLKLKYDVPLSSFAFKFNLRRYTKVPTEGVSVRQLKEPHSRRKPLKSLKAPAGLPCQTSLKPLEEAASESTSTGTLAACLKHIAGPVLVDEIGLMLATSALAAPVLVEGRAWRSMLAASSSILETRVS